MKKITSMCLVIIMILGVAACGKQEDPPIEIGEYRQVDHEAYYMPETIESTKDYRTAWKHAINLALKDGATYHGEHFAAMSIAYLRQELEEARRYDHSEDPIELDVLIGKGIELKASTYNADNEHIRRVYLDVNPYQVAEIERISNEINIGISSQILGKDPEMMLERLGITEEMLLQVLNSVDGSYCWYEEPGSHWYIAVEKDGYYITSLQMVRIENGHFQNIQITCHMVFVVGVAYEEYYLEEEELESIEEKTKVWIEREGYLPGHWTAYFVESGGQRVNLWEDICYFDFNEDGSGIMNIPGTTDGECPLRWREVKAQETEEGTSVLFEILPDSYEPLHFMYKTADKSAGVTDNEQTFAMGLLKREN